MVINKVNTSDGRVLLDLTSDTATTDDVLEGRTFHLASGVSSTGTYRPSDEIEARLEATVGHSSKNLLKIEADSQTINGVTFTVNKTAGTITVTNANNATANASFVVNTFTFKAGKRYILNGCPSGGGNSSYRMYAQGFSGSDNGNGVTYEVSEETTVNIRCQILKTNTVATLVFEPMIRDDSISDDTFEPYVTPTDERIEPINRAYLEATVGHSSKNLFKPIYRQGTVGNINTTSSVCCRTVINTTNGATHRFKCFDNSFAFRVYGLTEAGKQQLLSGDSVTSQNRPFDSNYIFSDTYEHTNVNSNIVAYAIMLRKTSTPGQENWIDITPSDVPNNIFMVVESPLTIDTFEPYVTPTDEKKQDKPVFLDTSILSWNIDELISQYAYLQFVFMDMQATSNHLFDIATVPTSLFTNLPVAQPPHVFGFSSIIAIRALGSTTGTSYITFFLSSDGTIEMSNTYTPLAPYLAQIIGIPK